MDSILLSIKKAVGVYSEEEHFDPDLIMYINSVFMILMQLGIGPCGGYSITDKNNQWSEFIEDGALLNAVKTYMCLKVRLLFDPPSSSSLMEAMNQQISEFEWRANSIVDY